MFLRRPVILRDLSQLTAMLNSLVWQALNIPVYCHEVLCLAGFFYYQSFSSWTWKTDSREATNRFPNPNLVLPWGSSSALFKWNTIIWQTFPIEMQKFSECLWNFFLLGVKENLVHSSSWRKLLVWTRLFPWVLW